MTKETLCWNCAKGADECRFMKCLEPVPNWKAKKVLLEGNTTYHVIRCPNFSPMRETKTKRVYTGRGGTKVRIVETGQVFASIRQCASALNVSGSLVSLCLAGLRNIEGVHIERVERRAENG